MGYFWGRGQVQKLFWDLLTQTNNFYFGSIALSCLFETFPGGWLAGWGWVAGKSDFNEKIDPIQHPVRLYDSYCEAMHVLRELLHLSKNGSKWYGGIHATPLVIGLSDVYLDSLNILKGNSLKKKHKMQALNYSGLCFFILCVTNSS